MMAKLVDLNQSSATDGRATCDVCVIGAGAAGLYLANRLSFQGLRVIILEAGGAVCGTGESIGIEPVFSASLYRGALDGRAFGWGGSTSRWGGALVPHSQLDLRDEPSSESAAWTYITSVVRERTGAVFATLGLGRNPNFLSLPEAALGSRAKLLRECGLTVVAGEFLPFRRRNLTYLASPGVSKDILVYLNAVATKWLARPNTNNSGTVTTVLASSQAGKRLLVTAKSFVIAAGAIESARILLEINRSVGERMFPNCRAIGRCLSDHLSCPIATVHPDDQQEVVKLFGPIFSSGRMRNFRFIGADAHSALPRHFAHFIFEIDHSGFRLVKDYLSLLQARKWLHFRLADVIGGLIGLCKLAYHRFYKSRLFIPPRTPTRLQLDIEQYPDPANKVYLGDSTDAFGRPKAVINWRVNAIDYENIRRVTRWLLMRWPDRSLGFPRLIPIHVADTQPKPYDAYHPVGTCKMGADNDAAVDLELKVRGAQNLYVLTTGVFPTAGTANPTFSMLCLGDMLADKIAKYCRVAGSLA